MPWGVIKPDYNWLSNFEIEDVGVAIVEKDFDLKKRDVQQQTQDACRFLQEQDDLLINGNTGIDPIKVQDWRL